jgi:hypothetical protein
MLEAIRPSQTLFLTKVRVVVISEHYVLHNYASVSI